MSNNNIKDEVVMSILKNAIETRKILRTNQGLYPTFIIYEITKNCNSRCVMCNIWNKEKTTDELNYIDIKKIFSQIFFKEVKYLNLSGGEPFIKKDFYEIVKEFIITLDKLNMISVATNGFLTNKIKNDITEILKFIKEQKKNIKFSVTVSIDGPSDIHNKIRGVKTAYDAAISTFNELKKLSEQADNFTVGIETVICKYNIDNIEEIYKVHKKLTSHLNFVPAIYSSFFENQDLDFAIGKEDLPKLIKFYKHLIKETPHLAYFYENAIFFLTRYYRNFPCLGGVLTAKIDSQGNLFPCLMTKNIIATKNEDYSEKWFGEKMNQFRNKKGDICKKCLSNCDMINNYYYEFFDVSRYYATHPIISLKFLKIILKDFLKGGYYALMISK
ncbi:MAG: radical SAM protein [Euryarchaeota archaeon]|nr:radical SAM protein [Euryarchaeota archaeon]